MFGSQALEVGIGLVFMFFLISLISSAVVEIVSKLFNKRANDLVLIVQKMIGEKTQEGISASVPAFAETRTYEVLREASKGKPSYMSAKAFTDAVVEMFLKAREGTNNANELYLRLPAGLQDKLKPLLAQAGHSLVSIRAELESWFDDTMDRLEGVYKRWSQILLFLVGFGIAVAANASAYGVAVNLWNDPVSRGAVIEAASQITAADGQPPAPKDLKEVAKEIDDLDEIGLPIGWKDVPSLGVWELMKQQPGGILGSLAGWLATALLVMLGAPFWFDMLSKLVSVRSSGPKPSRAIDDPKSASFLMATEGPGVRAFIREDHPPIQHTEKLFAALS